MRRFLLFLIPIALGAAPWIAWMIFAQGELAPQAAASAGSPQSPTRPPRRVISLSPNLTEAVFGIGAGDLLVGVTDVCKLPPGVHPRARCGSWSYPNFEVIRSLNPDLILVLGENRKLRDFCAPRGYAVESFTMDDAVSIAGEVQRLGRILGREAGATSLTRAMRAQLAGLAAGLDKIPPQSRPRVLISLGRSPGAFSSIMTPGGGSFLDEALTLAGGRNAFGDLRAFYPQVSRESLLARQPDVILELTGGIELSPAQRRQMIEDWKPFGAAPAVRNGRIEILTQDTLMMPGPGQPEIVRTLREAIFRNASK